MTITLNPDREAQNKTRVASGDFASVEEAARQLIDEALAERALDESDDLAWAKPYVDEALAESGARRGDHPRGAQGSQRGKARAVQNLVARVIVAPSADARPPWNILRIPACLNRSPESLKMRG